MTVLKQNNHHFGVISLRDYPEGRDYWNILAVWYIERHPSKVYHGKDFRMHITQSIKTKNVGVLIYKRTVPGHMHMD